MIRQDTIADYSDYYSDAGRHQVTRDAVNGTTGVPLGTGSLEDATIAHTNITQITLGPDDHASRQNFALRAADMRITTDHSPTMCVDGDYPVTVTYENIGQRAATNVTITTTIPASWTVTLPT